MTFRQIEYIVAVEKYRHFATAAENCCVTQPTLSMMINKAEDELGIKIFDRSKYPVEITPTGMRVIEQAKRVLAESAGFKDIVNEGKEKVKKEMIIGIIPSLSTYIVPIILPKLFDHYPELKIRIVETEAKNIVSTLKSGGLDLGIMAAPTVDDQLNDVSVIMEKFYLYVSDKEELSKKNTILYSDIDINRLWLLENEHPFVDYLKLFYLQNRPLSPEKRLIFESGCYQTLINVVKVHGGMALLPQLAITQLSNYQKGFIRQLESPEPERGINIITNKHSTGNKLIEAFIRVIKADLSSAIVNFSKEKDKNLLNTY
ncbi:MAG TPA: LysR substrate-binding domain-containing protein [Bacteroidia bacterium]|jgi:LysR family hydrogen peroxide-inducible transcriptional activator|nr:LysR substrate-binding domain-containing protein [Bacteroidia bacterium]